MKYPRWQIKDATFLGVADQADKAKIRYDVWLKDDVVILKWAIQSWAKSAFFVSQLEKMSKERWARETLALVRAYEDPSISPNARAG